MHARCICAALIFLGTPALACEPGEGVFMTCEIEGGRDRLEVCSSAETVRYAFGPKDAPELELRVPVIEADYHPWPGIGRAIAEGVIFTNGAFRYEVYAGFDRMFEGETEWEPRSFGGVRVLHGDDPVATRTCRPETVDFSWSPVLWDQKIAAGLRWDYHDRTWRAVDEFRLAPPAPRQ